MNHATRKPKNNSPKLPTLSGVGAGVFLALYGLPHPALAESADTATDSLQEITVTASRRQQSVEEVPYNLSVVSGDELARTGVTDLASLVNQVPGLSMYDLSARFSGSTTPVIRGLNASPPSDFRTFEQSPVGTYLGNSPINGGYLPLDDMQRVEVLRGPQGTLYGAGALGGAIRYIPNSPKLQEFSGEIGASGGDVAHSGSPSYTANGLLNVPIGDTLAVRISAKYAYDPGFVDAYGLLERTGSPLYGFPVLADPADPATSTGIFSSSKDWNYQKTVTGRASLRWQPSDQFNAELAYTYAHLDGNGGPQTDPDFTGGAYPLDPRITLPPGGDYRVFSAVEQPYTRTTELTSLDLSYELGFATLSSTSSYYNNRGSTVIDGTYNIAGYPDPLIAHYYTGNPNNPRFVNPQEFSDHEGTFSQEVRLVSAAGPDKPIDYVVGLFFENQHRQGDWNIAVPGTPEYSVAQGCTAPYTYGSTFPNCIVETGPHDLSFTQNDQQSFQDKSIFGELTWHYLQHGQITVGGRHFKQSFTDTQSYDDYLFGSLVPGVPNSAPASKNIWKINTSYEYATNQHVYATWSQGFRRGGANSVPQTGFLAESPLIHFYKPDEADNYEVGLKGRFENSMSYTFAIFDIQWKNAQIGGPLPLGDIAVVNANKAESKGFEFETSGPLLLNGLRYNVGFAYADAKLTESFSLPANNGAGVIVPGLLSGAAGSQLPGSPKTSAAATITYNRSLMPGYESVTTLNATYRDRILVSLDPTVPSTPSMALINMSTAVSHNSWTATGYVKNLADRRTVVFPPTGIGVGGLNDLPNDYLINRPREIGVRISYAF
jgi:iron complex outermembrane recepter protein